MIARLFVWMRPWGNFFEYAILVDGKFGDGVAILRCHYFIVIVIRVSKEHLFCLVVGYLSVTTWRSEATFSRNCRQCYRCFFRLVTAIVGTKRLSSSSVRSSPLVCRCGSASAAWCLIPARWVTSNRI